MHGLILARVNTNTFFIEQIVGDHGSGLLANGRQSSSQMNEKKRKEKKKKRKRKRKRKEIFSFEIKNSQSQLRRGKLGGFFNVVAPNAF